MPSIARLEVVHAEERARLRARVAPAGAVRRGVEAHRVFLADDDVAARAHRAGNHRPVVLCAPRWRPCA